MAATQPTFTEKSLPAGVVAQADYAAHTVYFDSSQVQAVIDSGQNLAQVIEHELLHLWMETGDRNTGVRPHPFPGLGTDDQVTVTLDDGTVLKFDQTATKLANGHTGLSDGYAGYEHIMIHQILLNAHPEGDETGAMHSAFLQATSVTLPGGQPQKITDDAIAKAEGDKRKNSQTGTKTPTPPTVGKYKKCFTTVSSAARVQQGSATSGRQSREIVVDVNGDVYEIPWDGAIY